MKVSEATILVVDDEPELLEIFAAWLSRSGCRVLTAANGLEALNVIQGAKIDAMISDIRMPVMDGIALVRRLHELRTRIPSIIFVSGFGDIDVREVYSLGVQAMITKPVSRDQLLTALGNCLARRSELWLTPVKAEPEESIDLELPGMQEAIDAKTLQFGQGGFCIAYPKTMAECAIAFSIKLVKENIELKGQGRVRWTAAKSGHLGIEFEYLEPATRAWLVPMLEAGEPFSYIPTC